MQVSLNLHLWSNPEFAMDNARFRNYWVIHDAMIDPDMNNGN